MEEVGTGVTPEPCKLQTEQSIHTVSVCNKMVNE